MAVDKQCETRIWGERVQSWQCHKRAIIERDGKWYCKIHDPEYVKQKNMKKQTRWAKEAAKQSAIWALKQARNNATEGLTLEELKQVTPNLIRKALGGI